MAFLIVVGLIVVAVVLLAIGFVASSAPVLLLAAIAAASAVVVLWTKASRSDSRPRISALPEPQVPNWEKSVNGVAPRNSEGLERSDLPVVAIDDYNELLTSEILPTLETLSVEQLRAVIAREQHGLRRTVVLDRAQKLIDLTTGVVVGTPQRQGVTRESRSTDLNNVGYSVAAERATGATQKSPARQMREKAADASKERNHNTPDDGISLG